MSISSSDVQCKQAGQIDMQGMWLTGLPWINIICSFCEM